MTLLLDEVTLGTTQTSDWFRVNDPGDHIHLWTDLTRTTITSLTLTLEASPDGVTAYALPAATYTVTTAIAGSINRLFMFEGMPLYMRVNASAVLATTDTLTINMGIY